MKLQLTLLLLLVWLALPAQQMLLTGGSTASATASAVLPTDGLAFHVFGGDVNSYPGSGNTWYDLSGNQKNVTIVGATFSGSYFDFDGSNDYGLLNTDLRTTGIQSWVFWVNTDRINNTAYPGIFGGSSLGTQTRRGGLAFSFFRDRADLIADFYSSSARNNAGIRDNLSIAGWKMYTMTFSAATGGCLYENDVLIACDNDPVITTLNWSGAVSFTIGRNDQNGGLRYYDGKIARVLKYDKALTAADVSQIYSATNIY